MCHTLVARAAVCRVSNGHSSSDCGHLLLVDSETVSCNLHLSGNILDAAVLLPQPLFTGDALCVSGAEPQ